MRRMFSDDIYQNQIESDRQSSEMALRRRQIQMDEMVKKAQLAEMGYNVKQGQGLFGGGQMTMTRDPLFVSTGQLQRQELMNKLDPNYEANQAAAKERALFGVRKELFGDQMGGGGGGVGGDSQFIMTPDGKFVQNRNVPKPLNALQEAQLADRQRKAQEEEQIRLNRDTELRESAEDSLNTISEVKKGVKYFGPMGQLPTEVAPSSLFGEYGPRKEWESNVNKLLSGKILETMTAMKNASKTGATGFGSLSAPELAVLREASTALNRGLTPEAAMKYLNEIEKINRKALGNKPVFGQPEDGGPSEEDIQFTMQKYGMSREQVLKELGVVSDDRGPVPVAAVRG